VIEHPAKLVEPGAAANEVATLARDADAVQRIHERAGHRADEIHEVPLEV